MADRQTTIHVAEVHPPGMGKKMATVKTQDGDVYGFFPDAGFIITAGDTYDIEYSTREYKGRDYHRITAATPAARGAVGHSGSSDAEPGVEKDEHIFVTGIVGRAMGSGKFGVTDIALLTKAAAAAYKDWQEGAADIWGDDAGPEERGAEPDQEAILM